MGSIISLYAVDNVQQFSTLASEVFTRNPKLFCSRFFTVIYLTFLSFKLGKLNNNKKNSSIFRDKGFSRNAIYHKYLGGQIMHLRDNFALELKLEIACPLCLSVFSRLLSSEIPFKASICMILL